MRIYLIPHKILLGATLFTFVSSSYSNPTTEDSLHPQIPQDSSCQEIDLRSLGHSMENVAVTNQGDHGICFMHSAMSALEAELKMGQVLPSTFRPSVLAAMIQEGNSRDERGLGYYNFQREKDPNNLMKSGDFCGYINRLLGQHYWLCDERLMEDALSSKLEDKEKASLLFKELAALHQSYNREFTYEIEKREALLVQIEDAKNKRNKKEREQIESDYEAQRKKIKQKMKTMDQNSKEYQALHEEREELFRQEQIKLQELRSKIQDNDVRNPSWFSLPQNKKFYNNLLREINKKLLDEQNSREEEMVSRKENSYLPCQEKFTFSSFKNLNKFISDVQDILIEMRPTDFLSKFADRFCTEKFEIPQEIREKAKCHSINNPDEIKMAINENFSKGPFSKPIPIGYDANVLILGKNYNPPATISEILKHNSLLIARKVIHGTCHYLVRNSWGPQCQSYPPEIICENGDVWIPASNMLKSIFLLHQVF